MPRMTSLNGNARGAKRPANNSVSNGSKTAPTRPGQRSRPRRPASRRSFDLDRAGLFGLCTIGVGSADRMTGRARLYRECFGVPELISQKSGDGYQCPGKPPRRLLQRLHPRTKRKENFVPSIPVAGHGMRGWWTHRAGLLPMRAR